MFFPLISFERSHFIDNQQQYEKTPLGSVYQRHQSRRQQEHLSDIPLQSRAAMTTAQQKQKASVLCSRLASLNRKLKTPPEMQEVCFAPRRKTNKMSSGLTAFGSLVTRTRSSYMLGPRDNKRCLTSRTLSHNSDGLEHNRS